MKKIFLFLYFIFISSYSHSVIIPKNLNPSQELLQDLEKIKQIKIPNDYFIFVYSKKFAELVNKNEGGPAFDLNKSVNYLAPDVLAVGYSIKQKKSETKNRFASYICNIHLFVPSRKDYWLPEGSYGDWYSFLNWTDSVEKMMGYGPKTIDMQDYFKRSFMANTELEGREDGFGGGSQSLSRYKKDIFDGVTYLEYSDVCFDMPKITAKKSIWLEKKAGPNYQTYSYELPHQKYFYHFPLPQEIFARSCRYTQRAIMNYYWSEWISLAEVNMQGGAFMDLSKNMYQCN